MSPIVHKIYIGIMALITVITSVYLAYVGITYYQLPLEERFYHPRHDWFKPSGTMGHGLGIVGTLMILFGVVIYIVRKRYNFMVKLIRLKHLLEFHIFLCFLGPTIILFHTAFKFGGVVSIAFWSMVTVVLSGFIGRFIYIQIPRSIQGQELSLDEIKSIRNKFMDDLNQKKNIGHGNLIKIQEIIHKQSSNNYSLVSGYFQNRRVAKNIKHILVSDHIKRNELKEILSSIKYELSLSLKIQRLQLMQRLFKYWHVAHLPFALIMLVIVVVHVMVTLALGYKWIF